MEANEVKHGDILYVDSSFYIDHGEDDICGGLATVKCVKKSTHLSEDNCNYYMIEFYGLEGNYYNLKSLLEDQNELKKEFGNELAHRCPDYG